MGVGPNAQPGLRSTGGEEARRDRGWVPESTRTTDGGGRDCRLPSSWGRLYLGIAGVGAGMTGWGARMGGGGRGWVPAFAEDNGWGRDGFSPPSSRGQAPRGNCGGGRVGMTGWGRDDGRWGEGDGSPHPRGQRMGQGRVSASVFIGVGSTWEKREWVRE